MKRLVIMRGLPGSGKSTKAATIQPEKHYRCSADDYHIFDGVYQWKPENVHAAHKWCQSKCHTLMGQGISPIVIDNTNIKKKDFAFYVEMAALFGYTVEYAQSDTEWAWNVEECAKRNTHNVPLFVVERMKNDFQEI